MFQGFVSKLNTDAIRCLKKSTRSLLEKKQKEDLNEQWGTLSCDQLSIFLSGSFCICLLVFVCVIYICVCVWVVYVSLSDCATHIFLEFVLLKKDGVIFLVQTVQIIFSNAY